MTQNLLFMDTLYVQALLNRRTDCISFVVMREKNLIDALTADRHFIQAGFRALLLWRVF